MSLAEEFVAFLKKYQVIGLAVAFIMGVTATKVVTAAVNDLIMPIIAVLLPAGDWKTAVLQVGPVKFLVGDFAGVLLEFVIIALVIFMIVKYLMKEDATEKRGRVGVDKSGQEKDRRIFRGLDPTLLIRRPIWTVKHP